LKRVDTAMGSPSRYHGCGSRDVILAEVDMRRSTLRAQRGDRGLQSSRWRAQVHAGVPRRARARRPRVATVERRDATAVNDTIESERRRARMLLHSPTWFASAFV